MGFEDGIWASSLGFEPCGWDFGLDAGIMVSKRDEGRDRGWKLGHKDGIWTSRLGFGLQGWD